jgi:glycosyltransferase involved in cell wall biosynthesis
MNILFAPANIASMQSMTTEALNKIKGINAKCIVFDSHKYNAYSKNTIILAVNRKNKATFLYTKIKGFVVLCRYILWADVIHWSWGSAFPFQLDIRLAALLRKKRFIEWVGSDIRVPEITGKESVWYKNAFHNGYEYAQIESKKKSYHIQKLFSRLNFVPILVPEMTLFLMPGLFKKNHVAQYRCFSKEKFPETFYPATNNDKIVIVHSPSAKIAKGSNYIIPVVEELQKRYPVEFILLHDVSHQQVIETMKHCDIFIDQIILGSYAAAAIEAMSLGKPVVAYIMPSVFQQGLPGECPVVNANPDTLKEQLTMLITNPQLRREIGMKSRQYVEKFHNVDTISTQLLSIYKSEGT